MRNLKKLFAVILTVAMIASMMVPALAANTYEAEALQLQAINVFAGGPEDLKLDESVTRIQGLAFAIRAAGKDAEALAMDVAEVDAILADWTDAASIPAWGRAYAAYAIKNGITVGTSATEKVFGAMQIISGRSLLVFIMKAGMGYADVTTATVVEASVEAGILSAGQAATFGAQEALVRDDAAGILFGAFSTGVNADGSKLIDAYIASGATTAADAAAAGFVALATMSVEATKVDTLEVTFSKAVDTADINLAVTKAGSKVDAAAPVWSNGNKVATIVTTAKMTNGTYTVTATSASDEAFKLTGTADIVNQYVAEIRVLNDQALTGTRALASAPDGKLEAGLAYIYYDVVDQYGESMRTSTNIDWSFSVSKEGEDRAAGRITLKRSDDKAFTYGEKIYVTGVYSRTGVSVTKEVTVGMKQALNSIEVAGFVKKGTTTKLEALPSGFKAGTYYMLYSILDQNGNTVSFDKPLQSNEVTFISDNVLLIKEIVSNSGNNETKLVIGGVEYNAVLVTPGMSVDKGGEANITAIANKTGNKTVLNVVVGENQILTSFVMSSPVAMIADNEKVEIPFVALDQNGNEITNFVTLAKQETFNTLTFTASDGRIVLSEKDDGTAKLEYIDQRKDINDDDVNIVNWSNSEATDGIDRMISLTSVVTGGDYSGVLLNIQDRARPEAIKTVDMDNVLVELGSDKIYHNNEGDDKDYKSSFVFLDQYGRDMKAKDAGAFFKAATSIGGIAGTNFVDYKFTVRATYKGTDDLFSFGGTVLDNNDEVYLTYSDFVKADKANTPYYEIKAVGDVGNAQSGNSLKFDIVKTKTTFDKTNTQAVSSARNEDLTIVDITAVRNFNIDDVKKFYIDTKANEHDTFALAKVAGVTGAVTDVIPANEFDAIGSDYKHEVKVKGSYNGETVSIPAAEYLRFSSDKLKFDDAGKLDSTSANAIKWSDFYDVTTSNYLRKDASDTVKVVIYKDKNTKLLTLDTTSKKIALSDAKPKETTIEGKDTWTVAPNITAIDFAAVQANKDDKYEFKVFDQYGVDITKSMEADGKISYKISSIEPNEDGYADNNFTVENNDTATVKVSKGAERGDTFVLTIKAGDVSKEVKVTVKADKMANITATKNNYLEVLIGKPTGTALEKQRIDGLN